jgi:hypothetical protein
VGQRVNARLVSVRMSMSQAHDHQTTRHKAPSLVRCSEHGIFRGYAVRSLVRYMLAVLCLCGHQTLHGRCMLQAWACVAVRNMALLVFAGRPLVCQLPDGLCPLFAVRYSSGYVLGHLVLLCAAHRVMLAP